MFHRVPSPAQFTLIVPSSLSHISHLSLLQKQAKLTKGFDLAMDVCKLEMMHKHYIGRKKVNTKHKAVPPLSF